MKVYTAKAAAEMMQICTETLRRLVREGAQHRRVGRRILFTEADIAAMLESKLMTGAVNPYARKQKQPKAEHTNEQQQPSNESDGGSTVAEQSATPAAA
jgi:predicted site-specific integrase-resolvase